jgi:hypothetical protein
MLAATRHPLLLLLLLPLVDFLRAAEHQLSLHTQSQQHCMEPSLLLQREVLQGLTKQQQQQPQQPLQEQHEGPVDLLAHLLLQTTHCHHS